MAERTDRAWWREQARARCRCGPAWPPTSAFWTTGLLNRRGELVMDPHELPDVPADGEVAYDASDQTTRAATAQATAMARSARPEVSAHC